MGLLDFISGSKDQDQNAANANPSLQPVGDSQGGNPQAAQGMQQNPQSSQNPQQVGSQNQNNSQLPNGPIPNSNLNTSIQNTTVNDYGTDTLTGNPQAPQPNTGQTPGMVQADNMPSATEIPQEIPTYSTPSQVQDGNNSMPSIDPVGGQNLGDNQNQEMQQNPVQQDPMQNSPQPDPLNAGTGLAGTNNSNGNQEETIFGDGDLADIYSNKFPNPNAIEPAPPAGTGSFDADTVNTQQTTTEPSASSETNTPSNNPTQVQAVDLGTGEQAADPVLKENSNTEVTSQDPAQEIPAEKVEEEKPDNSPPAQTEVVIGGQQTEDTNENMGMVDSETKLEDQASSATLNQPEVQNNEQQLSEENNSPKDLKQQVSDNQQTQEVNKTTPIANVEEKKKEPVPSEKKEKITTKGNNKSSKQSKKNKTKKFFKKIALLGLENSQHEGIDQVAKTLLDKNYDILIDSRKGNGQKVLLNSEGKVTGVYLKPIIGKTDEVVEEPVENNSFSILYSNYFEWIRHFAKDSRLFVFLSLEGMSGLALFASLINLNQMYNGMSKPIICVGDEWNEKIKQIISLSSSPIELEQRVHVVSSINDVEGKINEINDQYNSNLDRKRIEKVVDRRVEGDERDFIIF